eukprot:267812-Chlamydomonas_euryale.AAC.1
MAYDARRIADGLSLQRRVWDADSPWLESGWKDEERLIYSLCAPPMPHCAAATLSRLSPFSKGPRKGSYCVCIANVAVVENW